MRMKLLKIVVILLVAGSGETRPQKSGDDSATQLEVAETSNVGWRAVRSSNKSHDVVRDDSSVQPNSTHRDLKDLQYMDQSLRTVATQLLNVTNPESVVKVVTKELVKVEHGVATTQKSPEKSDESLIQEVNSEISNLESMGVSFGRPINSKFGYFETNHPGQAMAMTEEELEREMSTTRLITAYKNHPTTTGGISTWILLNPPSTTAKTVEVEKKTKQPFQTEVRLTVKPSSSVDKLETIPHLEKVTEKTMPQLTSLATTEKVTASTKKLTTTSLKKIATTLRPEKTTQSLEKAEPFSSTTVKAIRTTIASSSTMQNDATSSTTVPTTKKIQVSSRVTSKPKVTTPRTNLKPAQITTKPRPGQQSRPKPTATRRTTVKPEMAKNESASTGKIEKVTFKPIQMITTPKNRPEGTEKPMFVTKIKASVLMDTQKIPPTTLAPASSIATTLSGTTLRSNLSGADLVEVPVRSKPIGTKGNNVLKVQLKKPAGETTRIEIEPIKVNAPILKIEKVNKDRIDKIVEKDTDDLSNSRIDLKFDFNPELTKINVATQTEASATSTAPTVSPTASNATSTTKRPRQNSKRKKNKVRRRKPSRRTSVAPSTMTTVSTIASASTLMETSSDSIIDATVTDNALQESKIAPEAKVPASVTKLKKKQPPKTISTQIYNFLSREVMPNFGVMSLVGLGLGLASYFLYPFGGTISRRNYEIEPNYKSYSPEEYGGNYGQSEEEVLSKVFQGMTNHESRYPAMKDYNSNYYHYQHYDGAYDAPTTKKIDPRYPPAASTSPLYRAAVNTQSAVKYRNTDYRYSEAQTTPIYYDRKHPDLADVPGSANRQFVVGNVPKEYPYDAKAATASIVSKKVNGYESTEGGQTQFERDIAQSFSFPPNSAGVHHGYGHLEASTVRPDDGYEEIEITPTAVAVEHGPRAFKVKRAAPVGSGQRSRSKRESVIQVIPSKRELEAEEREKEREEDLSNEILDIIDLALPAGEDWKTKSTTSESNEVEDLEAQKKKQHEEVNTRAKESTTTSNVERTESTASWSIESTRSTTKIIEKANGGTAEDTTEARPASPSAAPSTKSPEATTVEWFESSTHKPAEGFSLFSFVKKVAEIKFRLGLTILKHASEGFARYLGHVQKRINGEE